MDWNLLLSLLCPLMMIFCMKGMFSKHNHCDKKAAEQTQVSTQDLQLVNAKIAELMEQNSHLLKEIQEMKEKISVLKAGNDNR